MSMRNPFDLTGKNILVTGASSGIGKAISIQCDAAGANLTITGRDNNRLQQTLSSLSGENHKAIIAELTNDTDRQKLIEAVDSLDGLVCCAGINDKSLVKFIKEEHVNKMLSVNFTSNVMLIQSLLKKKKLSRGASIVLLSSISSFYPSISNAMYASTKAALLQFGRVLALEVKPQSIRVNSICPAFVDTEMLHSYALQEEIEEIRTNYFNQRFSTPEEIAYSAQYLLSDATKMITGISLVIDGGYTL